MAERKGLEIDLSDHQNPVGFVNEALARFPNKNVKLSLEGKIMRVEIAENVHPQMKVEIYGFLWRKVREEIVFSDPQRATH